jgi:hypothetical protein
MFGPAPGGKGMNGRVEASTVYNGMLVAGGSFTQAGDSAIAYLASWDGSSWRSLGPALNGPVRALAVYNGALIVAGGFTQAGAVAANHIAQWNGATWSALGSGTDREVTSLALYGASLAVGGYFATAGGTPSTRVSLWNGSAWTALGSGVRGGLGGGVVYALAEYNGDLIAAGEFTLAGGLPASNIARWNGVGWSTLGAGTNARVASLAIYGGALVAGGRFTQAGGVATSGVARWDGATWSALDAGVSGTPCAAFPTEVRALVAEGDTLFAGGRFVNAGGDTARFVAMWNGASWTPLGSGIKGSTASSEAADADGDGISDCDELGIWGTNPHAFDTDGDGMNDGGELVLTSPPGDSSYAAVNDPDGDGLNNALDRDSDNDGINDLDERGGYTIKGGRLSTPPDSFVTSSDPLKVDTDGDSLSDGEEAFIFRTDPLVRDTDGDSLSDGFEAHGFTWSYPAVGLPGGANYFPGTTPHPVFLDPRNADSDGDGVSDGTEVNTWHTNPGCADTDGDGINDGDTLTVRFINAAGDTVTALYLEDGTDTDLDGQINALDANADWPNGLQINTDMRDRTEVAYGASVLNAHQAAGWILNPGVQDTDGDGYDDGYEVISNTDPLDARSHVVTIVIPADADSDGVFNHEEQVLGTNALNADTDGDSLRDGEELDPRGVDQNRDGLTGDDLDGVMESAGTDPLSLDTDSDAETDRDEYVGYGGSFTSDPRCADSDNDGLSDSLDVAIGANPLLSDTDGDGLPDNYEQTFKPIGTIPNAPDTDLDGLNDWMEVVVWHTDPRSNGDQDADGITDADEVLTYRTDPLDTDSDRDSLADGEEINTLGTNATRADSDSDLARDGDELSSLGTDPLAPDSDADGLPDGAEMFAGTNPLVGDTDGDGIADGQDLDLTSEGVETLALEDGGLYAGGNFASAGGKPSLFIARWDVTGTNVELPPDLAGGGPSALLLAPPRPNPARGRATFRYALPREGAVWLTIHDARGRTIATIVSAQQAAGMHAAIWLGRDDHGARVAPGVYYARLEAPGGVETARIAVVR